MSERRSSPLLRWSVYVLIAIAFAIACVFLSHWQFARNDDRTAQLDLVERNYDATPLAWDAAMPQDALDPALEWHPVEIRGQYLTDQQLVVRNRPHGGTSAFEVLTPLLAEDGRILIVDRGWVPPAETGDGPATIPAPPEGDVTVVVRLRPSEALPTSTRSAPDGQVPTINLPLIAESTGDETVTAAYGRLVSEDPAPAALPFTLDAPSADPGPHLSYAVQWILFAVMGFIFIGYIIRTELKHRREDAEETPSTPRIRRQRQVRTDRDMVDEDALLDHAGH